MVRYFYDRIIPKREGNLSWNHSSFILPCKDGHIHLTIFTGWETLIEWVASEGMAEDLMDEKWKDEEYRLRHIDHVIGILQRWTQTHFSRELFELGQSMRFPWAPVYSPEQVLENLQLIERGFFIDVDHPEMHTSFKYPGVPYQLSSTSLNRWKRAPLVGEDNVQIYQRELGFSDEELQEFSSLNVI
jgi:crotonobetainyl-CoA:carnitine CoA-transferase CaiB-like acyl-CoA transferase